LATIACAVAANSVVFMTAVSRFLRTAIIDPGLTPN